MQEVQYCFILPAEINFQKTALSFKMKGKFEKIENG